MGNKQSLSNAYPKIAKEWHPTKNGELFPDSVTPKSGRKVWWLGACGHEWEAVISSRTRGVGCPYCSNYKAIAGYNDLATTNPILAEEWNYDKNRSLKPTDVTSGSHKVVWWRCSRGHEWERTIKDRTSRNGCPYCANQKVLSGYNDLLTIYPDIAAEWSEKNSVSPNEVIRGGEK